jgi:hypothetical protein
MSLQEELERQRAINLDLRRKLEKCRRDTVEYCAKFCEDHAERAGELTDKLSTDEKFFGHAGEAYAKGVRGIIGV